MGRSYLNNKNITPKKSLVIGILVGGIVFGGIGVVASTYFSASQVSFTPSDETWTVTNVEDAINDLYVGTTELVIPKFGANGTFSGGNHESYLNLKVSRGNKIITTGTVDECNMSSTFSIVLSGSGMTSISVSTNGTTEVPEGYTNVQFYVNAKATPSNVYNAYFNPITIKFK